MTRENLKQKWERLEKEYVDYNIRIEDSFRVSTFGYIMLTFNNTEYAIDSHDDFDEKHLQNFVEATRKFIENDSDCQEIRNKIFTDFTLRRNFKYNSVLDFLYQIVLVESAKELQTGKEF